MKRVVLVVLILAGACALSAIPTPSLPAQQPAGDPAPGTILTNSIDMKLAYIPAGKFVMGSPPDEADREEEEMQHEVTISKAFYMGVYEVTQAEMAKVSIPPVKIWPIIFGEKRGGGPNHPRDNITWYHALAFCKAVSDLPAEKKAGRIYRLPTEAEWEYACRAGTTTAFHFGKSLSAKQANFNGNYPFGGAEKGPFVKLTTKVGSYPPNAWGLYDMHGNTAEWCADYYDKDYYKNSPKVDPQGPAKGVVNTEYDDFYRVARGGSWLDEGRACRAAYRFWGMPHDGYRLICFRVVCEVKGKS